MLSERYQYGVSRCKINIHIIWHGSIHEEGHHEIQDPKSEIRPFKHFDPAEAEFPICSSCVSSGEHMILNNTSDHTPPQRKVVWKIILAKKLSFATLSDSMFPKKGVSDAAQCGLH